MTAGGGRRLLVVDTATTTAVIALGTPDGALIASRSWVAGYRHGEELLAQIEGLLADGGVRRAALGGLVVGHGARGVHGAAGGIATVKGLAYALDLPVVGVPTGEALLAAAAARGVGRRRGSADSASSWSSRPAPSDRVLTRPGTPPRILPGGEPPDLGPGERLVAVDLDGREADGGGRARRGRPGRARRRRCSPRVPTRLRERGGDDLARLVPEYVTLPRGRRCRSRPPTAGSPSARTRRRPATGAARVTDRLRRSARWGSADLQAVQRIEHASFTTPWPPQAYRQELETNRLAHYLVGQLGDEVVAYGGIWLMVDEAHITTFAVHPALPAPADRGAAAARDARPVASTATPARRRSRSACRTSPRGGCTRSTASGPSGIRPRYYSDNQEDALIMTTEPLGVAGDGRPRRAAAGGARRVRPRRRSSPTTSRPAPAAPTSPTRRRPGRARRDRTGRAERAADPGGRVELRRDRRRARRGRAADPRQRRREPDRAPRADGRHRARGGGARPPALDRAGARRGARDRRREHAGRRRRRRHLRDRARRLAAGRHQRRQVARLGARQAAVPVNHLEGHVYAGWLLDPGEAEHEAPPFPLVALVVSGGHTFLVEMRDHLDYRLLGQTVDDAAGEAFDKVGRLLGLGYPGGPAISRAAEGAKAKDRVFPRAWLRRHLRPQLLGAQDRGPPDRRPRRGPTRACRPTSARGACPSPSSPSSRGGSRTRWSTC